ncbi:MAG: ATP-binding protein [Gemmataceae bacterium]
MDTLLPTAAVCRSDGNSSLENPAFHLAYFYGAAPFFSLHTGIDETEKTMFEGDQAAQALHESEERFRLLVEGVKDYAIFMLDSDNRISSWNPGAERILGFREEEILGQSGFVIFVPEDVESGAAQRELDKARTEGRAEDERWHVRKDGSRFWASGVLTALRDERGGLRGLAKILRDITPRKQAEDALRQGQERLRLLVNMSTALAQQPEPKAFLSSLFDELSSHLDLDVYFNYLTAGDGSRLQLKSYGGVSDEVARRLEWLDFGQSICGCVARDHKPLVVANVPQSTDPRTEFLRSLHLTAYACFPLLVDDQVLGTLSFGTRRRPAFNADEVFLMHNVADHVAISLQRAGLIEELRHQAAKLAERDRRKDEFLAMLSHELRNPLAPILNALHVLRQDRIEPAVLHKVRGIIERQVRNMAHLVDDLMEANRITQGKIHLRKEPLELSAIVDRASETVRTLIDTRQHELIVSLPTEPIWLEADPTRLEQILTNLLTNAAKYTDPQGRIWVTARRENSEVVLRVRDSGVGIPQAMLDHIFELFTQVDRSIDRTQGGLGIGLNVVRRLVELHGGSVQAFSEGPGKGSEFTIRLPVGDSRTDRLQQAALDSPSAATRSLQVLVVDDNVDAAESLAMLLRLQGYTVDTVHSGQAALEAVGASKPDAVLLDIGLPGMDGYEVAHRLRKQFADRKLAIVAMSGYGQEADFRRSREIGFDLHLTKPVDPDRIQELLKSLPKELQTA